MRTGFQRIGIASVAALVALMASTATVGASCAPNTASVGEVIRSSPVVFVGTVTATGSDDRDATVRVEEIWQGGPLAQEVTLHGSSVEGNNAATSVDRRYTVGTRYLFVPVSVQQPFDDNICTATQPYGPSIAAFRPGHPQPPLAQTSNVFSGAVPAAIAVLAGAGLGVLWLLVRRRRRPLAVGIDEAR